MAKQLALGEFRTEVAAALAHDLAAREMRMDPAQYNFGDGELDALLRVHARDVVAGLSPSLPPGLRALMVCRVALAL